MQPLFPLPPPLSDPLAPPRVFSPKIFARPQGAGRQRSRSVGSVPRKAAPESCPHKRPEKMSRHRSSCSAASTFSRPQRCVPLAKRGPMPATGRAYNPQKACCYGTRACRAETERLGTKSARARKDKTSTLTQRTSQPATCAAQASARAMVEFRRCVPIAVQNTPRGGRPAYASSAPPCQRKRRRRPQPRLRRPSPKLRRRSRRPSIGSPRSSNSSSRVRRTNSSR